MSNTITVAGSLARRPGYGGHTWVFLQYLLGFRRLGWDVLLLDRLEDGMDDGGDGGRYLAATLATFGFDDAFALLDGHGMSLHGLPREEVLDRVRDSTILLNVMGYLDDEEIMAAAQTRVFLDIDPGFGQMWCELGLADQFSGHDAYVTIAENIGKPDCEIPTCGLDWISTVQPIVLEHWPEQDAEAATFTSVGSWRGPYDPIEFRGKTYGLRVHEFRRFVDVPRLTGKSFEVALDIDAVEAKDIDLLVENDWTLADPRQVAGDPFAYRTYVRRSKAEFMVAKNMYVESRSGWFSDRSICYLASGRPVLAQDTGLSDRYQTGEGLLLFRTLEEAVSGVEEISENYQRHSRAARALAEEHFDSDKVLSRLLAKLAV